MRESKHTYNLSGPSNRGLSWHKKVQSECPRRLAYEALVGSGPKNSNVEGALAFGIAYHAFQDLYTKDSGFTLTQVEFTGQGLVQSQVQAAYKLFRKYRAKYGTDHWGGVLATEKEYVDRRTGFTMRADLITGVGYTKQAELQDAYQINVPTGTLIVDWKTVGGITKTVCDSYVNGLSATLYQHFCTEKNLSGMLFVLICKSSGHILPLYAPPPSETQVTAALKWLKEMKSKERSAIRKAEKRGFEEVAAWPDRCYTWNGQCPYTRYCR